MADEEAVLETREKDLLSNLSSFLSGCSGSTIDSIQCCIVLLQSLPCARHAVLEQLCDAFHESMHKYMVEMERKAQLLGTNTTPDVVDADLDNALHSVCDVVRDFVNINPSSWALLICQWCFNLLGDLISKFDQKRGVSLTLSFSEGFHKWMSFPPVQMLMAIATHCCSKLVVSNPDSCMETLLQISMKYSPHLDWVVAHIVSHFHDVIVKKLLSTALKDYASTLNDESEEKSVLVSTVVQVLGYLSIQFAQEIKTHLLALFHSSLVQDSQDDKALCDQLATIPFLLHIASLSPELLKGSLSDFVESLTPSVLEKLYNQSVTRASLYTKHASLIPVLVDVITNIETGAYGIFWFLMENCCPDTNQGDMETPPHQEVQNTSIYIMERLLWKLQEVTSHRHKLYTQKSAIAPLVKTCTESAFLLEMSSYINKLIKELLQSNGKRFGWLFRMAVLVSVHSGETTAIQVLSYILLHGKTNKHLNIFVQMQCEIEFYYQDVLRDTLKKCVALLSNSNATIKPQMVLDLLDNIHQLVVAEKTELFPPRCKIIDHLQVHCSNISSLITHSNAAIASKTMSLLLMYDQAEYPTAATKGAICRAVSSFFFRQLKDMVGMKHSSCTDIIDRIQLCTQMLTKLSRDNYCRQLLIRIMVECALMKENAHLLGGKSQEQDSSKPIESNFTSLLEYNQNPHISSRLALSPSSLFFTGVIGNKKRNEQTKLSDNKTEKTRAWLPTSQVYIDTLSTLCKCCHDNGQKDPATPVQDSKIVTSNTDLVASLLMERVCPEVVPCVGEWPDEDGLKFTIERDIKIRKTFDDNPILWWMLLLISQGRSSLCKCAPITSSLLATVMSNWEVCRDRTVTQSSELFRDTQYIMQAMVEANWLPAPLSRVGGVLHLLSPKEVYAVTNTMWKVLKENPPHPNMAKDEPVWKQGSFTTQKEVVKAIFINNISTLGQHYARVFQSS